MPPSVRYSMPTLGLSFRWATSSFAQRKSANRVGANTQPCLTPVSTEKASERRPLASDTHTQTHKSENTIIFASFTPFTWWI